MDEKVTRKQFFTRAGVGALAVAGAFALGRRAARTGDTDPGEAHDGYPDAVTHKVLDDLKEFTAWLGAARGYVGEVGVPSNLGGGRERFSPDQERWKVLGEAWYDHADAAGLWVTAHEVSERYYDVPSGGYYASLYLSPGDKVHKVVNRRGFQASLVEAHPRFSGVGRGVNFSGGQQFDEGSMSNADPGAYGTDYWYPTVNDSPTDPATGRNSFEYLASVGVKEVRVGFRWERMQPALGQALSPVELSRYRRCLANAAAAGLKVIVDCHNYGGYYTGAGRQALNSPGCPTSAFVDLWRRVSANLEAETAVSAYDLMNEPYNGGGIERGSYASESGAWEGITEQVVAVIRGRGDSTPIMVPLYCPIGDLVQFREDGDGAIVKTYEHRSPWISADGLLYAVHHYFDSYRGPGTGGGRYAHSYAQEDAFYASFYATDDPRDF